MLNRFDGNVVPFASEATLTNRTVFGAETQSDDIDDNLNADFKKGWEIVGLNDNPTREDFNAMGYTLGALTSYLYQMGIAEWNDKQEYKDNSRCQINGKIYRAKTGTDLVPNVGNNPLTDTTNWELDFNESLVENIAELKTISGMTKVEVLGYYTKGDGGGGTFYWDSTSTESDNGGTVISATGITTGRWKRVFNGAVNVKWFNNIKAALESGFYDIRHASTATLTENITISSSCLISGGGTINVNGFAIRIEADNVTIRDINFIGNFTDRSSQPSNGGYILYGQNIKNATIDSCSFKNSASCILLRGVNTTISNNTFENIGSNVDGDFVAGWGACISSWYLTETPEDSIKISNNTSTDCSAFSFLNGENFVLIENNTSDLSRYITCGQQLVRNLIISGNIFSNSYDNTLDCQQCSNTTISDNKIINPGRSTDPATGDRKAIFWGTDGAAETIKSNCSISGNTISIPDGDGTKGGWNLASLGGNNITVSNNVLENVKCVSIRTGGTCIVSGNVFDGCSIDEYSSSEYKANLLLNTILYIDSGYSGGSFNNNKIVGFYPGKDHSLFITGVSAGITRYSIKNNDVKTNKPRLTGFYFIEFSGIGIRTIDMVDNTTDAMWLIKDTFANFPTYFKGNSSQVISGNSDTAHNAEMIDVIYYTGIPAGADIITIPAYGKFFQKTRRFTVVLQGSGTCALGTYEVSCFDSGGGRFKIALTEIMHEAGSYVDFTCVYNGATYGIDIQATGSNGPTSSFIIYLD